MNAWLEGHRLALAGRSRLRVLAEAVVLGARRLWAIPWGLLLLLLAGRGRLRPGT